MKRNPNSRISSFLAKPKLMELEARETPAVFFVNPALAGSPEGSTITAASQAANFAGAPLVNGTYSDDANPATTPGAVWFSSIEAALAQAAANGLTADTIYLSKGVHTANNAGGAAIVINDNITMIGSGTTGSLQSTVSPANNAINSTTSVFNTIAGRTFNISNFVYDGSGKNENGFRYAGSTSSITNIVLEGAGFDTGGGVFTGYGIFARDGSNLTITNLTSNTEGRQGVSVFNSKVSITGSTFLGQGSGIPYAQDGVEVIGDSRVTISSSLFSMFQGISGETSTGVFLYAFGGNSPQAFITRSDFAANNVGIFAGLDSVVDNSSVLAAYNNFLGNIDLAIQAGDMNAGVVNARFNWWGDPSGAATFNIGQPVMNNLGQDGVSGPIYTGGVLVGQPVINVSQPLQSPRGIANVNQSDFATGASVTSGTSKVRSYTTTGFAPATQDPISILPGNVGGSTSRIAFGDITGDGVKDFVIGSANGLTGSVEVYNGSTGALITSFVAFAGQGVNVALGDLNGDGVLDVICGSTTQQSVKVYDGASVLANAASLLNGINFNAYPTNTTGGAVFGVNVAAGDINGDGLDDIITAPMSAVPSNVKVFDAKVQLANPANTNPTSSFFAYQSNPNNLVTGPVSIAVNVAAGDINGDGLADIATAPQSNYNIRVFRYTYGSLLAPATNANGLALTTSFFASSTTTGISGFISTQGIRLAVRDLNNDGYADLLYASAVGNASAVYAISGSSPNMLANPYWNGTNAPGTVHTLLTAAYSGQTGGIYLA